MQVTFCLGLSTENRIAISTRPAPCAEFVGQADALSECPGGELSDEACSTKADAPSNNRKVATLAKSLRARRGSARSAMNLYLSGWNKAKLRFAEWRCHLLSRHEMMNLSDRILR